MPAAEQTAQSRVVGSGTRAARRAEVTREPHRKYAKKSTSPLIVTVHRRGLSHPFSGLVVDCNSGGFEHAEMGGVNPLLSIGKSKLGKTFLSTACKQSVVSTLELGGQLGWERH